MLQLILSLIRCIFDFQKKKTKKKTCASKTAGLRVKDTSRSLCYPVYVVIVFHLVKQSTKSLGFLFPFVSLFFFSLFSPFCVLLSFSPLVCSIFLPSLCVFSLFYPYSFFFSLQQNDNLYWMHHCNFRLFHLYLLVSPVHSMNTSKQYM